MLADAVTILLSPAGEEHASVAVVALELGGVVEDVDGADPNNGLVTPSEDARDQGGGEVTAGDDDEHAGRRLGAVDRAAGR